MGIKEERHIQSLCSLLPSKLLFGWFDDDTNNLMSTTLNGATNNHTRVVVFPLRNEELATGTFPQSWVGPDPTYNRWELVRYWGQLVAN